MPLEPLREKYESFGWFVYDIDGNDIDQLLACCSARKRVLERPVCIIAHTIPGKGVEFIQNKFAWHSKAPDEAQAYTALLELRSLQGQIIPGHME